VGAGGSPVAELAQLTQRHHVTGEGPAIAHQGKSRIEEVTGQIQRRQDLGADVVTRLAHHIRASGEGDKGDKRGDPHAQPQLERAADKRQSISTKAHEH